MKEDTFLKIMATMQSKSTIDKVIIVSSVIDLLVVFMWYKAFVIIYTFTTSYLLVYNYFMQGTGNTLSCRTVAN